MKLRRLMPRSLAVLNERNEHRDKHDDHDRRANPENGAVQIEDLVRQIGRRSLKIHAEVGADQRRKPQRQKGQKQVGGTISRGAKTQTQAEVKCSIQTDPSHRWCIVSW